MNRHAAGVLLFTEIININIHCQLQDVDVPERCKDR